MRLIAPGKSERFNFAMFLSGRTISVLLSSVYTFAVGLFVLKMTGSGLSFAITLTLQILPTVLFGPFAGVLADKFDKKLLVVSTDAFNGFAFILLFLISRQGLTLSSIYVTTLLISISQTLYNISVDSAVPNIVSEKNLLRLNSISKIIDSTAAIVSPSLGGILFTLVGMRFFILLNGIAFFLSTVTECLINFKLYSGTTDMSLTADIKKDLTEGVNYILKTGWIRNSLANFLVLNFFMALLYAVPIPYLLNNIFRLSSANYGIVQCFMPAGMILGAFMVRQVTARIPYDRLLVITGLLFSCSMLLMGLLPVFNLQMAPLAVVLYYGVLLLSLGWIISLIDIPFINNFQTNVPENIRGRALSIGISAVKAITPAGYILSGAAIGLIPSFYLSLGGGVILLLAYGIVAIRRLHPTTREYPQG